MRYSVLVAISENQIIGRAGNLPWHLSSDLRRFKRLTMGRALVMGRRTWESIGKPLLGRTSIVMTRRSDWCPEGAIVAHSFDAAIELAMAADVVHDEVFLIGGGDLYRTALPQADRIYLTRVHATIVGDTTFPTIDWSAWRLVEQTRHPADAQNDYPHTFEVWDRRGGNSSLAVDRSCDQNASLK